MGLSVKMGDLFGDYEKDFSILTADIVAKTNRIPNLHGEEKRNVVNEVEQKLEDAQELLEQMDLEARGLSDESKAKCGASLKSYKLEVQNLERNLKKSKIALTDLESARSELLGGEDGASSEDQRSRLLDNSERLERSNRRLDDGYKLCVETEEIGQDILGNLSRDRETMTATRDRLRGTNTNLHKSSRVLTAMMRRLIQNRILLVLVCLVMLTAIGVAIYFASKK